MVFKVNCYIQLILLIILYVQRIIKKIESIDIYCTCAASPGTQFLHPVVAVFSKPLGIWIWVFWHFKAAVAGQCSSRQADWVPNVKSVAISLFPHQLHHMCSWGTAWCCRCSCTVTGECTSLLRILKHQTFVSRNLSF